MTRPLYSADCRLGHPLRYPAGRCCACRFEDKCRAEWQTARDRLARLLGLTVTKGK